MVRTSTHNRRTAAAFLWIAVAWLLPACARAETQARDETNPVAALAAVVTFGHARFTVLTPQLIRMEWAADGHFEDHASLVFLNRHLPVPPFSTQRLADGLVIQTAALTLRFCPLHTGDKFDATNLQVDLSSAGQAVQWKPGTPDTGNLLGTARTLDNPDRIRTTEPALEPGLISRDGWVLVDDSQRPLFDSSDFRFSRGELSPWPWVTTRPPGDRQDWYIFGYGHQYKQALADFVKVAGRIPLPPPFAFGSWWSRYWAYSDQELAGLVQQFHQNDVPLDVLVIDMEWHNTLGMHYDQLDASGNKLGWTGYTWDRDLFPSPEVFLRNMHRQNLHVTLNLHPAAGVQPWEEHYPEMARAMGLDPAGKQYVPFDITSKKYATNYFNLILHPLEKQGVDFWWLDWQQGETTSVPGLNPIWWLNYVHFTDQQREGKRPLLFHRWGGLGNHRYQIGFSGDTISDWAGLRFQPYFTATAANVGYAYWSHDIGGHIPGAVDPELYTRWVQFGVFSPILRTHTTKSPDAERRIWTYPEPYAQTMRDAFQLREQLEPYLYTEARRTYDSGLALLHPLYYEWPEEKNAFTFRNEYMFGDSMMVAPVTQPADPSSQLATQQVWIPPGEWIEWMTGKSVQGPKIAVENASIDQVPVFIRQGAILPLRPLPAVPRTSHESIPASSTLQVVAFPLHDGQHSSYCLYDDSGEGEAYKTGEGARTTLSSERSGNETRIRISPQRGVFLGSLAHRSYEISLPSDWPPVAVKARGRTLPFSRDTGTATPHWSYDGNTLTTHIYLSWQPASAPLEVLVFRKTHTAHEDEERQGIAASLTRLHFAYNALNKLWPAIWSPRSLLHAFGTGDRLTIDPTRTEVELRSFPTAYDQSVRDVQEILDEVSDPSAHPATHLRIPLDPSQKANALSQLRSAGAQLADGEPK